MLDSSPEDTLGEAEWRVSKINQSRRELVEAAVGRWADDLISLDFQNPLLRFRTTKTTTLDLTPAELEPLRRLMGGQQVRVVQLFQNPEQRDKSIAACRGLLRRTRMIAEEQGIDTGRVAVGILRGPPPRPRTGNRPGAQGLLAPLVLRPVSLRQRGRSGDDFDLQADSDSEVNPVLLYALRKEYGVDVGPSMAEKLSALLQEIADPREQAERVAGELSAIAARVGVSLQYENRVVAGSFIYEKLPMVEDLRNAGELLAGHDLVAAIAGDPAARAALAAQPAAQLAGDHDRLQPSRDFAVLDADSSQQNALDIALAERHLVIDGPPGTGKSQTIANLITVLAAHGQRVLFVAEKRAAIEAVTQRLSTIGLDQLVFDLHHDGLKRRDVAKQLADTLDRAFSTLAPETRQTEQQLIRARDRLVAYNTALHAEQAPWRVSAYNVLVQLAELPETAFSDVRFPPRVLDKLDSAVDDEVRGKLAEFADMGGLRILRGESPWSGSAVRDSAQVQQVLTTLNELRSGGLSETRAQFVALVRDAGLQVPDTIAGWRGVLGLVRDVTGTLDSYRPEVFGTDLPDLHYATAPRAWRRKNVRPIGFWRRRALVKQARSLSTDGVRQRARIHAALTAAIHQREAWERWSPTGSPPCSVPEIGRHMEALRRTADELAAITACAALPSLEEHSDAEVDDRLRELSEDTDALFAMPDINALREYFERLGLTLILEEAARRGADAKGTVALYRYVWAASVLEQIKIRTPLLASFNGSAHEQTLGDFRQLDVKHQQLNVDRVRREAAEGLRRACDDQSKGGPAQAQVVRREAAKKSRHLSLRQLVEQAPDVLLSAFPCWAMSPLNVSRSLPAMSLFDVVVFDEASQVEPQDAITSIMRGRRLIVAGDDKQLPPSRFFRNHLAGGDDAEEDEDAPEDLRAYESILDKVKSLVPDRTRLRWHYRSRDERLIAFSNKEIYDQELVTFPGLLEESPLSFEKVDSQAVIPGQGGSPSEEVQRVVALVREHARAHPTTSLGVITLGSNHRDRVEMELNDAQRADDVLAGFLAQQEALGVRVFVKNLETVQGDERDAIILSPGYARPPSGRNPNLGPIQNEGGERRLNVAVTRAREKMTIVSSFSHFDLDPDKFKNRGPKLLYGYLEFAAHTNGERLSNRTSGISMNALEQQVYDAMKAEGLPAHPQWGAAGYRIDFALAHPEQPGRMVLAVETDGERYHKSPSARDRDRLRQQHLENLGWRFHRVWSLDWARDPQLELERIKQSWWQAVARADAEHAVPTTEPTPPPEPEQARAGGKPRGPRPAVRRGLPTDEYSNRELIELCDWLMNDGLPLDREQRVREAQTELGVQRLSSKMRKRLEPAYDQARRLRERRGEA